MRPLSTVSEADTSLGVPGVPGPVGAAPGSVRSGSGFWAAGHRTGSGTSSSAFTASSGSAAQSSRMRDSSGYSYGHGMHMGMGGIPEGRVLEDEEDLDADADAATEVGKARADDVSAGKERKRSKKDANDEIAAQDAFIAGMVYSLSQRILPGPPYTPASALLPHTSNVDTDKGRWRLEDCLRRVPKCMVTMFNINSVSVGLRVNTQDVELEIRISLDSPKRCSARVGSIRIICIVPSFSAISWAKDTGRFSVLLLQRRADHYY